MIKNISSIESIVIRDKVLHNIFCSFARILLLRLTISWHLQNVSNIFSCVHFASLVQPSHVELRCLSFFFLWFFCISLNSEKVGHFLILFDHGPIKSWLFFYIARQILVEGYKSIRDTYTDNLSDGVSTITRFSIFRRLSTHLSYLLYVY